MVRSFSSDLKVELLRVSKTKDGVRKCQVQWTSSWVSSHFLHNKQDQPQQQQQHHQQQQLQQQQQQQRQQQLRQQQQPVFETLVDEMVFDPVSHEVLKHTLGKVELTDNEQTQIDSPDATTFAWQNDGKSRKCSQVDREKLQACCIKIEDDSSVEAEPITRWPQVDVMTSPQDMDIDEEESNEGAVHVSNQPNLVSINQKLDRFLQEVGVQQRILSSMTQRNDEIKEIHHEDKKESCQLNQVSEQELPAHYHKQQDQVQAQQRHKKRQCKQEEFKTGRTEKGEPMKEEPEFQQLSRQQQLPHQHKQPQQQKHHILKDEHSNETQQQQEQQQQQYQQQQQQQQRQQQQQPKPKPRPKPQPPPPPPSPPPPPPPPQQQQQQQKQKQKQQQQQQRQQRQEQQQQLLHQHEQSQQQNQHHRFEDKQPIPLMQKLLQFNDETQKLQYELEQQLAENARILEKIPKLLEGGATRRLLQSEQHYGMQMHPQPQLQQPHLHILPLPQLQHPYLPPPLAIFPPPMYWPVCGPMG